MPASVWLAGMLGIVLSFCFFLLILHTIYRPPMVLIKYFQRRWPDVLLRMDTKRKLIALTIDDAPSQHTQRILEVLQVNNAHATFFIIGSQVPGHEQTLQDIIRAGNELGNHAMYDEPSRALSDSELQSQIRAVDAMIREEYSALNMPMPKYFRPGSGFFSTRMRALVAKLGYRVVLGNIYPHDPQIPFWRINAWHVLSMLQPGGIVICHDRRAWTAPMLRNVLTEMRRRGYRIVTVTELLNIVGG
jgi:peptidoglycan/xylan/chitin deacetylase (PgdA/CDA1 family)